VDQRPRPPDGHALPVAASVLLLAVALMAWDHLWGNQDGSTESFPVDPLAFGLSSGLVLAAAALVFRVTVPRAARVPDHVHRGALWHSGAAAALALPASWLGFPVVIAGGGIALGIQALAGPHQRLAFAAILLGLAVAMFAILTTAFPANDTD
jgi:hypothetical protein